MKETIKKRKKRVRRIYDAMLEYSGTRPKDIAERWKISAQSIYRYTDIPIRWLAWVTKRSGLSVGEVRPDLKGINYTCEHCGKKGKLK